VRGWRLPDLHEALRSWELLTVLVGRDVKIRYRQTFLGAAWAILQPVLTTGVVTVLFNRVAHVPSQGVPYALFALAGLVPWTFFSNAVTQASNSLVTGADLVRKVYFPRVLVPTSSVLATGVDLAVSLVVLLVVALWYRQAPGLAILLLPVFVVFVVVVALATSLLLAALNVRYRDVRFAVPFLFQIWFFVTPIVFPTTLLHGGWRLVAGLNPMAGVVDGFRWCVLGTTPALGMILVSVMTTVVLVFLALGYFGRFERTFADVI
jgi:lipopolysaccharide transport system permease protein